MLKKTTMKRAYVQQNSVNEEKEIELKNRMADNTCHPEAGDSFCEEQILNELQENVTDHNFTNMRENETSKYIPNEQTKMIAEYELKCKNCEEEPSSRNIEHIESGYSLSSSSCDNKVFRREKRICIRLCKAVGAVLVMALCGAIGFIISTLLTKQIKAETGSKALPAVGIPSSDIPVFGLFTVDDNLLAEYPHAVRWVPRSGQIPHFGVDSVTNDSCVQVRYSGLYKVENQITFKFKQTSTEASHSIVIKRNDGTIDFFVRRQIFPPLFKPKVGTVHQPSNIGVLASLKADEQICVRTYPNNAIYISTVDNVLDVELRILFPENEEFEFRDPEALKNLDLDSDEKDILNESLLQKYGFGKTVN